MPSTQENYILQQRRAPILQLASHQPGFSTSTVPIPLFDRANTTTSNVQTLSNSNQDDGRLDEILVEDDVNREASVETGWDAYAVVIGAWFALFVPTGLLNTIGTYQAFLGTHQLRDYSDQQIGWIFSVYAFLLVFGGSQVGPLFDAYGLRRLLIPGFIGLVTALMAFSFCTEYYQFMLSIGILGGLSASCLWTTSLATTGHWFSHRRGIATGVVTSAGPVGGIVFPLLFEWLVPKLGFAWTIRIFGFICLATGLIAIALMKTRLPSSCVIKWNTNFGSFTDLRFLLTLGAIFAIDFACLIPVAYITTYALAKGLESALAYQLLGIINAAAVVGRLLPGWLADRWGRFNVMILSSLPCAVAILGVWLTASSAGSIVAFSVLFGLLSGTAYSLTPVCISQLCRTEDYGSKYGTAYLVLSPATLIGIPIAGAVLNRKGEVQFQGLIILCGSVYMASAVLFTLARVAGVGWKIRKVY